MLKLNMILHYYSVKIGRYTPLKAPVYISYILVGPPRFEHGTQPHSPLLQVTPGSLAQKCGLMEGDIITKIGDAPTEYMRHKEAQQKIVMSGNSLELALERWG